MLYIIYQNTVRIPLSDLEISGLPLGWSQARQSPPAAGSEWNAAPETPSKRLDSQKRALFRESFAA